MQWLLLRGLGRESAHWDGFPESLLRQGEESFCLDLPGTGTDWKGTAPLRIAATVENLRARLKSDQPIGLIAVSLGGMVALDWANRYPAEISRMVLINSSVSGIAPPWKRLRPRSIKTLVNLMLAQTCEEKELATLKLISSLTGAARLEQANRWAEIRRNRPVSMTNLFRQLFAAFRFKLDQCPRCPTLVVQSLGDGMVDPTCSLRLSEKLGADLLTHPTAGHDLSLDDPNWLAEKIASWAKY